MKNKTLLIAVLIIIVTLSIVTPVSASLILKERWTKDLPEYEVAISPDGYYVASGSEYTDKARNFHFYNKNGDVLWDRYFAQGVEKMAILSSGETIIGDQSGKVYKFDVKGNLEWIYETEGEMEITTNNDGNPIYYEGSYKFGKLNSQGEKLWEISTLSSRKDYWDISTTLRGDRLALYGYEFGANPDYLFITMYDGDANKLWEKAIVEPVGVRINSVGTRVIAAGKKNLYHFDGTGNLIDTVNIEGDNRGIDITDNLIATTGTSGTFLLDYKGNILNKISKTGDNLGISGDEQHLVVGSFSGVSLYSIEQDTTDPTVSISSPDRGQSFNTDTITVSGTAYDDVGLNKIEVKVNYGDWLLASGTTSWSKEVTLTSATNTIYAKATDTSGRIAETSVTINYITQGSISVSSDPSDASIYLDGIYKGTTPKNITGISEGSHTIILKRTDYKDWSQTVNVVAGQISSVTAPLNQIPTTGSISVSSSPSGASIYLDGSYQGTTPFTITNVAAGSHTITLKLTDYLDWSQTVVVVAGQTSPVTAPLTQIPISEIIAAISVISGVIVIYYIFIKPTVPAPPKPAPPEGHLGDDKGGGYPEENKAAAPPVVGKEEEVPVLLAVSAPEVVKPGDIFTARLAAYIKSLEEEVKEELIKLSRGRSESYMGVESCRWKLDTRVTIKLSGKHLKVDPPESEFVWKGERNLVNFLVEVLADAPEEWTVLRYEVFIEDIRVAFIPLDLEITSGIKSDKRNIATIEPAHTAFASYASQDRLRVLDRVAAVRISAGLDIFMDCLSIHPGEEWKKRLESEIEKRDLFLLFWSANAKDSEWVTWEWKTALVRKGESAIQLHPLQSATEAPPPEELRKFHFGDVYMIVRNA